MSPSQFIKQNLTAATTVARQHGVPSLVVLVVAALESGWGKKAPGYNYFGYTAPAGYVGRRQLLRTVEYHSTPNVKYPVIIKVTDIGDKYKYEVKRYFKSYTSPVQSFTDFATLLKNSPRYAPVMQYASNPQRMLEELCESGYATNPEYKKLVMSVMNTVNRYI